MNKTNYEKEIEKKYEEFEKAFHSPTIAILGGTGCGKSSLINTIFGEQVAKVSNIQPETQEFEMFKGKEIGINVNLIDSKGYELEDNSTNFIERFKNKMTELKNNGETVHLVWFCLSVAKKRIEDIDINILQELLNINELKNRIIVVITKCDEDDDSGSIANSYKEILSKIFPKIKVFETSNDKELPLQLDELLQVSADSLEDEDMKKAFINSQKNNLALKRTQAEKVIPKYVAGAGVIGATPIPFSDAPLLISGQLAMFAEITSIYGVRNMNNLGKGVISQVVIGQLGKSLAGSLIKLIPGVGTIVGGAINATVASSITYALGKAISEICYRSCENVLQGKNDNLINMLENELPNLFKYFFSTEKNK